MLKISLIGILSILSLFGFDDGVIVTDTTPAHMNPGESVTVDITITKAQIESFGKLLINIPDGFTAEEVESQGASFTFSNNKVKFIWMTLPKGEVFTVKYMLVASNDASLGDHNISGIFSYIKNNQRVDYRMTEKIIKVTNDDITSINIHDNSPIDNGTATQTPDNTANNVNANVGDNSPVTGNETQITCYRTYERIAPDQFKITLRVVRAGYIGFAKIADVFSIAYAVAEGDSDGAVTVAAQGKMKYVWFEVPEIDEFYVTYFLTSDDFATAFPEIKGKISVVENGEPKDMPVINILEDDIFVSADNKNINTPTDVDPTDVVSTPSGNNPDSIDTSTDPDLIAENPDLGNNSELDTPIDNNPDVTTQIENKDPDTTTANTDNPTDPVDVVTNIPNPETGVTYKVQILAAHKTIGRSYFKKRHSYAESFDIESHEGWIKYTTGSHSEYKQARDSRERINSKYDLPGPFVTAYNEGERITVQEALMITKQQWYQ